MKKKYYFFNIPLIILIFMIKNISIYAQRSRDFGRDYSDMPIQSYSVNNIIASFILGPVLFMIGQALLKYHVDEKGNPKSFFGVVITWASIICFIPALQFLFSLSLMIFALVILGVIIYAFFSTLLKK
ncbi:hypothetical protein VB776_02425 [Arcicella sp. DC2W]|uniref:Uncharacterized protein n=1 Tax=Arcicella gelida TaxID=2984195 RepID=A0ABU5RZX0_9BACT|nr:hypothetical protein [Arcicella sp. DC2W]MEA5401753.1 hypothetical protein [Arcicella sp. DC2W]